ncbi:ribosomal L1 domain-containing protein 1-like [Heracleum sosnowskyi]|uniref:Ribosomal L1 domain-containing protein 1-like n=1 Tax=Heracleum sosnowskyi TaxID=360622 RepID=A0AAD8IGB5_9APIA|nr:ribosomal L1 domain-containing protein 1-like [Heracleum sosnowskyi]
MASPAQISPSSKTISKKQTLDLNTLNKAIKALLQWKKLQKPQSLNDPQTQLDDDFIYLLVTLKKVPRKDHRTSFKIPLVHPLEDSLLFKEVCLIIDDRPKSNPKFKTNVEVANEKIKNEDLPVSKVLKFSTLRSEYKSFEAKKKLYEEFDVFFVDKRVEKMIPGILGKVFYGSKKKVPVAVSLGKCSWKEEIERGSRSVMLKLSGGTCSLVKVGRGLMGRGEIFENVVKVIEEVVEVVPRKWAGVRSFHLKFTESLAMPIYQALGNGKLGVEGKKENVVVKEGRKGEGKVAEKVRSLKSVGIVDDDDEGGSDGDEREAKKFGSGEIVGKKRKDKDSMMSGNKRVKIGLQG